jgi:hypothetical protein
MLKKDITYNDLDGNPITETFWFHLSKAEMAEMALEKEGKSGGFESWVKTMIASNDGAVLVPTFKKILLSTIGERSADNKRFIKNEQIRQDFEQSDAYSVLFMDLMTDMDKMTEFINGVVPKDMSEAIDKAERAQGIAKGEPNPSAPGGVQIEEKPAPVLQEPKDDRPDWLKEGRVPTEAELKGAKQEHILEAFKMRSQAANS